MSFKVAFGFHNIKCQAQYAIKSYEKINKLDTETLTMLQEIYGKSSLPRLKYQDDINPSKTE